MKRGFVLLALMPGCGLVHGATKTGIRPILDQGIEAFAGEPDPELAQVALAGQLKLVDAVQQRFPDDSGLKVRAAMARATYAFGFLQDEWQAVRWSQPERTARIAELERSMKDHFALSRSLARQALGRDWSLSVGDEETAELETLRQALEGLSNDQAEALFWLAFAWAGSVQIAGDAASATQLPKIQAILARTRTLDEDVFFEMGPDLLEGGLKGFRAPALGGDPEGARQALHRAAERGRNLLPRAYILEYVLAQTGDEEGFRREAQFILDAAIGPRPLFDRLAKRRTCRLWAQMDRFFLVDPPPIPAACAAHRGPIPYRSPPVFGPAS
ncbi:MAG: TRAP transporter TatT component family protein [Myxococcota bacterium]